MFDEVVFKTNVGCKLLVGPIAEAHLGKDRQKSIIAISHSLDKLVVNPYILGGTVGNNGLANDDQSTYTNVSRQVYYISVNDVIKTVGVKNFRAGDADGEKISQSLDFLLIGCVNSILIYDCFNQSKLSSVRTSSSIDAISLCIEEQKTDLPTVCGGPQKVYALRFDSWRPDGLAPISVEVSSERSTSDTVTCLASGCFNGLDLVLTGSIEQKLRLYQLDAFDHNIQGCKLTIEENGPISCLCPINTLLSQEIKQINEEPSTVYASNLPQVSEASTSVQTTQSEQMSHIAFGTENSVIGVYRLFNVSNPQADDSSSLRCERLWRQRCKQTPIAMLLFDINGDGLDELLIGFGSGRLDARSPFTGQLLATTRCFKQSDKLAGITLIDCQSNGGGRTLLACSTNGFMVGFKPRVSRPKVALRGFSLPENPLQRPFQKDDSIDGLFTSGIAPARSDAATSLRTIDSAPSESEGKRGDVDADLHIESTQVDSWTGANGLLHATRPSKSDARQSHDLLLRVSALHGEQLELEKKARQMHHTSVYQAAKLRSSSAAARDQVSLAYRWDFDVIELRLKLTLIISCKSESLHLVELTDESKNILETGHSLITPATKIESASSVQATGVKTYVVVVFLRTKQDLPTKIIMKAFCESTQAAVKESQHLTNKSHDANIYTKSVEVPQFAMIIPEQGASQEVLETSPEGKVSIGMRTIKLNFRLRDKELQLAQILDWLRESFLCFRFGNLINDIKEEHLIQSISANLIEPNNKLLVIDDSGNFDLSLLQTRVTMDKSKQQNVASSPGSKLKVGCSGDLLTIECESLDLAVTLVRSLVIDRLRLDLESEFDQQRFTADVEPILDDLDALTKSSRQLEESERRIQTELYESADHTKNLLLQLNIANELNEFTTARDLLNELFILLSGVQNAAKAQTINNRSHLEITKQVNELREKVIFLTGHSN